jgi:hypothetical protein
MPGIFCEFCVEKDRCRGTLTENAYSSLECALVEEILEGVTLGNFIFLRDIVGV